MSEAVRLVIWDLDETFWQGTLSEGGHSYSDDNHNIVVELARRGIMSAICSKNDMAVIRPILEETGIWDYFVFASIDWSAKGPRIADIIARSQLRAASVMFIDDNPMNRNEALHFAPDIQVRPETFIADMLDSPRFTGKDDRELTRLKQYKLLESKQHDQARAGGDNHAFLRNSHIRVVFDHDVAGQIDRAIELINRTNQLNFTKKRLPEDAEAARAELGVLLSHRRTNAALVRVVDDYGDYGYVGFYAMHLEDGRMILDHFCFSCRTLNMGIETWVYRELGRPQLEVAGEVLSDVIGDETVIDWIFETTAEAVLEPESVEPVRFDTFASRGGCDQSALGHYFARHADRSLIVHNFMRNTMMVRPENHQTLRNVVDRVRIPPRYRKAFEAIGHIQADLEPDLLRLEGTNNLIILSFWMDHAAPLYRHKATGIVVPMAHEALAPKRDGKLTAAQTRALAVLEGEFEALGPATPRIFEANVRYAVRKLRGRGQIFVIRSNSGWAFKGQDKRPDTLRERYNRVLDKLSLFPDVETLDILDFIESEDEIQTVNHFDRMVYYRLYQAILSKTVARRDGSDAA